VFTYLLNCWLRISSCIRNSYYVYTLHYTVRSKSLPSHQLSLTSSMHAPWALLTDRSRFRSLFGTYVQLYIPVAIFSHIIEHFTVVV